MSAEPDHVAHIPTKPKVNLKYVCLNIYPVKEIHTDAMNSDASGAEKKTVSLFHIKRLLRQLTQRLGGRDGHRYLEAKEEA